MAGITNTIENKLLDHLTGDVPYVRPATTYLALYTTAPTDSTPGAEVTGGGYDRQEIVWDLAAAGEKTNSGEIDFGTASEDWGEIVAFGVLDNSISGTLIWYGNLTSSKTILAADTFAVEDGALKLTLD